MLLIVGLSMGSNPSGSFDSMRKFILIVDLAFIIWFVALQFYRFKETGRACSGDYLQPTKVKDAQGQDRV